MGCLLGGWKLKSNCLERQFQLWLLTCTDLWPKHLSERQNLTSLTKEEHFWTRDLQRPRNSRKIQSFASIQTVQQSESDYHCVPWGGIHQGTVRTGNFHCGRPNWRSTIPDFQAVLSSQLTLPPSLAPTDPLSCIPLPQYQRLTPRMIKSRDQLTFSRIF